MPHNISRRVLVIENSRAVQSALKAVDLGPRIALEFTTADSVLEHRLSGYAAILADDTLFDGTATETLMMKLRSQTSVPVIYMTVIASARAAQMAIASGVDAVLKKPFGASDLRNALGTVLQREVTAMKAAAEDGGVSETKTGSGSGETSDHIETNAGRVAPEAVFDQLFYELERRQPLQPGFDAFDVMEKQLIRRALESRNGNQSQAARFLGITRNTLRKRIQKYGFSGLISKDDEGE